jgi:uncharacterized protein involved in exopolysaccharide biosynthesis
MITDDPPLARYPSSAPRPAARMGVLQAIRRSIALVLLPVILLVGGAVAYGLLRSPTYTSEARLSVGGLNLTTQTLPGYTTAVQQLAVAYSRAIDATNVIAPVAARFNLSQVEVARRVSAAPIEGSPVIRVRATSGDPGEAVQIADATARSLVNYAIDLNSGSDASARLLRKFVAASRDLQNATAASRRLKLGDPRRKAAKTREDIAQLQLQTASSLYQQSQVGRANLNLVQRLAPAAPATSDRDEKLQQLIAGALIGGLLIGVGLAVWRGNRVLVRRLGKR